MANYGKLPSITEEPISPERAKKMQSPLKNTPERVQPSQAKYMKKVRSRPMDVYNQQTEHEINQILNKEIAYNEAHRASHG